MTCCAPGWTRSSIIGYLLALGQSGVAWRTSAELSACSAGLDLLILDDWGLEPLDAQARHDLLEILEERYGRRSTIVTSQLPIEDWHAVIADATYADAILDRLVHNAHRLNLTGESLRKTRAKAAEKG
jgi:DNA replication protein DnaC